jgi:hypothetical protein
MGAAAEVHRQPGTCRARQGRQATGAAAMMARQAAARGRWLVKSPAAACALARGGPVSCSLRLRRAVPAL